MSYHDELAKAVDERIEQEPRWLGIYHEYMVKLKKGFFADYWVDVIMQTDYHNRLDMYEAAYFAEIWTALSMGWIVHAPIGPVPEPFGDSQEEYQNAGLASLPNPFRGKFKGGVGDNDGHLYWDEAIGLADSSLINAAGEPAIIEIPGPGSAPLEVGYTRATTSFLHLASERYLARWPYGSNAIWLLKVVRRDLWIPDYESPLELPNVKMYGQQMSL